MLDGCTPWPPDFEERYIQKSYWQEATLGDVLDQSVLAWKDREAIVFGSTRISYKELGLLSDRLALHLLNLGLNPKERVVFHLPNLPELILLYYACAKAGLIPVMCLPAQRHAELSHIVALTEARAYVIAPEYRGFNYFDLADELKAESKSLGHILVTGQNAGKGKTSLDLLLQDPIEKRTSLSFLKEVKPHPGEVGLFLLSGGTTGLPKLIPRTHRDYVYNFKENGRICGVDLDTVFLTAVPIAHNFALASPGIQSVLACGGKVVLSLSTDPKDLFSLIQSERVTMVPAVPAMIVTWLNWPGLDRFDLSSLRTILSGGAKLNPEVARRIRPTLGSSLQQVLGMAEGLLCWTRGDDLEEIVFETVGRPMCPDDEIRIVDDQDREVSPGEVGELLCRGPYTLRGYYKAEEHNRVAFTPDGFYRTGDMVRQDQRGNLIVEGRKKDMINRGGEKISAEEIENLILAHPDVENVAVVAMPDPVMGERSCAYVILRRGKSLSLPDLVSFLEQKKIAKFKLPERLEIVARFPLTTVGKISKKDLRDDISKKLATGK
jgi:2,3-dihydroxybenzoate-AMP ligase